MYTNPPRNRPNKRVQAAQPEEATTLSEEFVGLALAFGNTLLFVGYEVNSLVEIVVYPRYRFSSDDRVQGHLGYVRVPFGTPWEDILAEVEAIYRSAEQNYRLAVGYRSSELRAHGSQYETAYEAITDLFRESWHGFALRLKREDKVAKDGVVFSGHPPGPVLANWRGKTYTVQVFSTGSITMLTGDQQRRLRGQ
jgi:hypothetical protein